VETVAAWNRPTAAVETVAAWNRLPFPRLGTALLPVETEAGYYRPQIPRPARRHFPSAYS
jgi:hypothetical protein